MTTRSGKKYNKEIKEIEPEDLLENITNLVNQYNKIQLEKPNTYTRLIVEKHNRSCRCGTCWYKFGGNSDSYDKEECSIYTDIYNSDTKFYK